VIWVDDVAWCGLLTTCVLWSDVDTVGRAEVDWSCVGAGDVCVALRPWVSSASNGKGGEQGSLSLNVGSRPSSPLRSARMSSQAAGSKKRTGDPSEP